MARGRGRRRPDRAVEPVREGFAPGGGAVGHVTGGGTADWRGFRSGTPEMATAAGAVGVCLGIEANGVGWTWTGRCQAAVGFPSSLFEQD